MALASFSQKFQDWVTQQWVILFGTSINPKKDFQWLLGPFGSTNRIGQKFIQELIQEEGLKEDADDLSRGLLESIDQLDLKKTDLQMLSKDVIDFYERTSNYSLNLTVHWNPFFKIFGKLLKILYSNRLEQLNIPMDNRNSTKLASQVIYLNCKVSTKLKRTIWLRKFKQSEDIVYSGVYETCRIPNGKSCIKAIFPLPNGNATVILEPSVSKNGSLILSSSGKKIGESGFYFVLRDSNNLLWAKHIKSFKDQLIVYPNNNQLKAEQTLKLWGCKVVRFDYEIKKKLQS